MSVQLPARPAAWRGPLMALRLTGGLVPFAIAALGGFAGPAAAAGSPAGTFATGGNGGPLGSGHSIAVSRDGGTVVAVNAGSNSISAFDVRPLGLRLIDMVSSDGVDPNSVAIRGDLVYVLGERGAAGPPTTTPSTGGGPFGSDFDRAGHLLVSDAALATGVSGASSYDVFGNGTVVSNGSAVPIDQAAACWLAAAKGFAFTANSGSGSIGRYAVGSDGFLTALGSTRVEGNGTSHPLDEGVSEGQNNCTSSPMACHRARLPRRSSATGWAMTGR